MNPTFAVSGAVAAVLRVTGEDAFSYLQSQFSGDLRRAVGAGEAVYGLWLSRKGRVDADGLVVSAGRDELWVISYYTPAVILAERVGANLVADDANVEAMHPEVWTVVGDGAREALSRAGLPAPRDGGFVRDGDLAVVSGRRGAQAFEVIALTEAAADRVRLCINHHMTIGDAGSLERLRLSAGVPRVPEDCGPGDLPQEAGLDADGVSFDKGCFLGQEVMARLKAQGRATRFLARVTMPAGLPAPAVGAPLWVGDAPCGEIRSSASIGQCQVAFAMLKSRAVDGIDAFALAPGGDPVVRLSPFV